jgi:hypothetical protein
MNNTLSQSGAPQRETAQAVAQQARANWERVKAMAVADRMQVETVRAVPPAARLAPTPTQIREEVMADLGLDRRDLIKLGAQARLEAEISIEAETRKRARQAQVRSQGVFLDLKA